MVKKIFFTSLLIILFFSGQIFDDGSDESIQITSNIFRMIESHYDTSSCVFFDQASLEDRRKYKKDLIYELENLDTIYISSNFQFDYLLVNKYFKDKKQKLIKSNILDVTPYARTHIYKEECYINIKLSNFYLLKIYDVEFVVPRICGLQKRVYIYIWIGYKWILAHDKIYGFS